MTTIGSLCSGYDGLAMGLQAVVGGDVWWQSENDKHAARILEVRYPGVPNLGDLTAVDWASVLQVDWLCAGFPCQPASAAGARKGMTDERWLWDAVAGAIQGVRPRRVLLENVPGLLTVDRGRAFERVICDLASLGYVGRYRLLRASDVGAPHRRERLFVVAESTSEQVGTSGLTRSRSPHVAADSGRARLGQHPGKPSTKEARSQDGDEFAGNGPRRTPADSDDHAEGNGSASDIPEGQRAESAQHGDGTWGAYELAITRWQQIMRRNAPRPTEPGPNGHRLAPRFVEWMMGLPAGWVTEVDIPRNAQLKALGNGCVPQQVAAAVSSLLPLEVAA